MASTSENIALLGDTRLGAILTRMGLVSKSDVLDGLSASVSTRLPLGNVLIIRRKLSRPTLRLAVEAQWMIKDGLLDHETAYDALHLARRNDWNLSDALIALGSEAYPVKRARLGDLLLRTQIMSEQQLAEELELANLTGLPLGRVIVARRRLSEGTVWHAIQLQQAVRAESLELEQAAEKLTAINSRLILTDLKTAELLVAANRLNKRDVEVAIEMATANYKTFGQVVKEMEWLPAEVVERAGILVRLLKQNRINYGEAIFFMREDKPSTRIRDLQRMQPQHQLMFYDFLKLNDYLEKPKLKELVTRLVADEKLLYSLLKGQSSGDKKHDVKMILADNSALAQVLKTLYPEDVHSLYCAKAAYISINDGSLTPEEALIKFFEVSRGYTPVLSEGVRV